MDGETYQRALQSLRTRLQNLKNNISSQVSEFKPEQKEQVAVAVKTAQTQEIIEYEYSETAETQSKPVPPPQIQILMSKKDQLKKDILHLLAQGQKSTIELKKILVDKEKKCSKASFYRYVQELKREQEITVMKIADIEYCVRITKEN